MLAYGEWVEANVLAPVPHRQYVFTVPRLLRPMLARRRALLEELCNIVERLFARFYASARPGARPGIILFVQTFGDLVNFNPHIHVLAADGAFDVDGSFSVLPPIPRKVLEPSFRAEVLALLRREGLVSERLAETMLAWRHTGFSAHNSVRVRAGDPAGRRRLAQLCAHIPDRFEHLVRYAGWYSNRSRGKRKRMLTAPTEVATREVDAREAARVRSTWARLLHKVYEVDPLECPKCKGPMRVISLIDDKAVIRKILTRLGLWAPQTPAARGPGPPAPDPPEASEQILTYHPVPDIA